MKTEVRMDNVYLNEIYTGNRAREKYPNIDELIVSINKHGLIQPIAVFDKTFVKDENNIPDGFISSNKKYLLLGGGRRLVAFIKGGISDTIPCRIYDEPLTMDEIKEIELFENLQRIGLTFIEEINLKEEIHELQQKIKGVAIKGKKEKKGHSVEDTAQMLGESKGTTSRDIALAKAIKKMPQLANAKTKADAWKMLQKLKKDVDIQRLAHKHETEKKETSDDKKRYKLEQSFIIGKDTGNPLTSGFFEKIGGVQDKTIDLIELDPPYSIDLHSQKKGNAYLTDDYSEINPDIYPKFIEKALAECYRVMKDHSWLICWFGPDPWFYTIENLLRQTGFKVRMLPSIWYKGRGQTQQPNYYLASTYEMFVYARKGSPSIQSQGRQNVFIYPPINSSKKTHATERPVELMEDIIRTFCHPTGNVLVPFAGSGNTILAANNLHLNAIGYEIHKKHRNDFIVKVHKGVPHKYRSYNVE